MNIVQQCFKFLLSNQHLRPEPGKILIHISQGVTKSPSIVRHWLIQLFDYQNIWKAERKCRPFNFNWISHLFPPLVVNLSVQTKGRRITDLSIGNLGIVTRQIPTKHEFQRKNYCSRERALPPATISQTTVVRRIDSIAGEGSLSGPSGDTELIRCPAI